MSNSTTPTWPPLPPTPTEPAPPAERAVTIDALRGVAILGILLLNVRSFAMPNAAYQYPFATPTLSPSMADLWAFAVTTVVGQGKFLTIFATLYGAGILLATRRADAAEAPAWPTFGRRSFILAGVGLLHMFLVWHGDILFAYAVIGLVAFAVRRWETRWMWTGAALGILATCAAMFLLALLMWAGVEYGNQSPVTYVGSEEEWQAEIDAYRGGYLSELAQRSANAAVMLPVLFILFAPQLLGLMLAGMALLRSGFLTGDWPGRWYVIVGVTGAVIGFGGSAAVTAVAARADWPIVGWFGFGQAFILLFTPVAALSIASLWIGHVAAGRTPWLSNALAAVGRMAFTNYLLQSVAGAVVFYTFDGFGRVGYFGQLGFVAAVWAVQVPLSLLWLSRFRYGPLEWVWRGLTYGRFPQLRRGELAVASEVHGK